ncbi:unnamed protein product [Hymenolepis diminuta]|uniref:Uncharacterized protein n=1 Tax=Hymenolepis diminuta TaxID=6216 RepID=A0A564XXY8_HYMDI|nr:unnamed protein product [Hymenolepis diminuta]
MFQQLFIYSNKTLVDGSTLKYKISLPAPTLPAHLLSSSARSPLYPSFSLTCFKLVVASLNTVRSNQFLAFYFTIVVSSYSNGYELVFVIC